MEMTRTKFWAAPKFVRRPRDSGRRRPIRRDGRGRRRFSGRRGEGDGRRPGRRADGVPRRPGRRGDGRGGPRRPGSRAAGGTRRPGDSSLLRFVPGYARSPLGKFVIGGGSNMSDFTYVENVAHANICAEQALCSNAASVAGKPFFVTNDEPMETWEFMNCIMEAMGCQRPRINLPAKMLLSAALFSNMIRHRLPACSLQLIQPAYQPSNSIFLSQ